MLKDTSPWLPILITVFATGGAAALVWRLTGNRAFAAPTAFLILALASAALGTIATVAYIGAAVFGVMSIAGFVIAWRRRP